MMEGVLSIQAGDNPRIVQEKLKAFLAPKRRADVDASREGAKA
jgi:chemotaxis protein MotA